MCTGNRVSMGSHPMYIETVLTCEGNFYAPDFSNQLSMFCKKFESLITNGNYAFHGTDLFFILAKCLKFI